MFLTPSVIVLRGKVHTDGDTIDQKQNEDSFYAVLAKLYLEWVFHHGSELLDQAHQTVFHTGRNQKAEPHNRNNAAKIKDNVLLGKLIFPHGQLSFFLSWSGHQ